MRSRRHLTVPLILVGTLLLMVVVFAQSMAETQTMREAAINEEGLVHELFRAASGELWISDFLANEIWRVDPASGAYTVYGNLTGASDGRLDSQGNLWWSDFDGNALGRLVPGAAQATLWPLSGDGSPLGIAFGDNGQVWVTDVFEPTLHRFTPDNTELCDYAVPNGGTADYILFQSGLLWLGDPTLGRILRFNPNNGEFASWQLPSGAYPQGMAIDGSGQLWWADPGLGALGRLDPQANTMTIYAVPTPGEQGAEPAVVAISNGDVWYTNRSGSAGMLDPALASGDTAAAARGSVTVSPTCKNIGTGTSISVSERSGTLNWVTVDYPLIHNDAGWLIYDLPNGSAPWGLAASGDDVWFADQGTPDVRAQQLGWMQFKGGPPPGDGSLVLLPVIIGK